MKTAVAKSTWVAAAAAVGLALLVIAVVIGLWRQLGDVEISTAGWLAMAVGALATLALGIGLMALVFISNRRGYDDGSGDYR